MGKNGQRSLFKTDQVRVRTHLEKRLGVEKSRKSLVRGKEVYKFSGKLRS